MEDDRRGTFGEDSGWFGSEAEIDEDDEEADEDEIDG